MRVSVRAATARRRGRRIRHRGIVVSWGDRTRGARARSSLRARHRYRGAGAYPLAITASDAVGNATRSVRTVRIG